MEELGKQLTEEILKDAKSGQLWLYGELNEDNGMYLVRSLKKLEADANCNEIIININSDGGCTRQMFAIADLIRRMRPEVTCIVDHIALSAGGLILACGDKRVASESASILIHGFSWIAGWDKTPSHKNKLNEIERREDLFCNILEQQTKKAFDYWKNIVSQSEDKWFGAEEALEVGLIDEIIRRSENEE
jgi:ATP-dependent Clp protease, protease subunit